MTGTLRKVSVVFMILRGVSEPGLEKHWRGGEMVNRFSIKAYCG